MISRQRHHQRNSDRKKWRRSKRGRGSSKTCVSPASNSNSFPHSSTGQPTRNFSLLDSSAVGCVRTTQAPHLGQVTHEHAMRSAISGLYCLGTDPPWTASGARFRRFQAGKFCGRAHFGWWTMSGSLQSVAARCQNKALQKVTGDDSSAHIGHPRPVPGPFDSNPFSG